jgi:hypothetical protein
MTLVPYETIAGVIKALFSKALAVLLGEQRKPWAAADEKKDHTHQCEFQWQCRDISLTHQQMIGFLWRKEEMSQATGTARPTVSSLPRGHTRSRCRTYGHDGHHPPIFVLHRRYIILRHSYQHHRRRISDIIGEWYNAETGLVADSTFVYRRAL